MVHPCGSTNRVTLGTARRGEVSPLPHPRICKSALPALPHPIVPHRTLPCFALSISRKYRYWETLNLIRKGLIITAVTFITDQRIRIYACMWLIMLFLALQYTFEPFESKVANALETASLLVITISLNLSLLWLHPYFDPGPACCFTP